MGWPPSTAVSPRLTVNHLYYSPVNRTWCSCFLQEPWLIFIGVGLQNGVYPPNARPNRKKNMFNHQIVGWAVPDLTCPRCRKIFLKGMLICMACQLFHPDMGDDQLGATRAMIGAFDWRPLPNVQLPIWGFPQMGYPTKSSIFIRFSLIKNIHFGVSPIYGTPHLISVGLALNFQMPKPPLLPHHNRWRRRQQLQGPALRPEPLHRHCPVSRRGSKWSQSRSFGWRTGEVFELSSENTGFIWISMDLC